jgi:hypothetical protein
MEAAASVRKDRRVRRCGGRGHKGTLPFWVSVADSTDADGCICALDGRTFTKIGKSSGLKARSRRQAILTSWFADSSAKVFRHSPSGWVPHLPARPTARSALTHLPRRPDPVRHDHVLELSTSLREPVRPSRDPNLSAKGATAHRVFGRSDRQLQ